MPVISISTSFPFVRSFSAPTETSEAQDEESALKRCPTCSKKVVAPLGSSKKKTPQLPLTNTQQSSFFPKASLAKSSSKQKRKPFPKPKSSSVSPLSSSEKLNASPTTTCALCPEPLPVPLIEKSQKCAHPNANDPRSPNSLTTAGALRSSAGLLSSASGRADDTEAKPGEDASLLCPSCTRATVDAYVRKTLDALSREEAMHRRAGEKIARHLQERGKADIEAAASTVEDGERANDTDESGRQTDNRAENAIGEAMDRENDKKAKRGDTKRGRKKYIKTGSLLTSRHRTGPGRRDQSGDEPIAALSFSNSHGWKPLCKNPDPASSSTRSLSSSSNRSTGIKPDDMPFATLTLSPRPSQHLSLHHTTTNPLSAPRVVMPRSNPGALWPLRLQERMVEELSQAEEIARLREEIEREVQQWWRKEWGHRWSGVGKEVGSDGVTKKRQLGGLSTRPIWG